MSALFYAITLYTCVSVQHSTAPPGCDYYSTNTHVTTSHQLIFDTLNIQKQSIEIEFDIKMMYYCNNCKILYIKDILSFELISNTLRVSVNNKNVFTTGNANILLPIGHTKHVYLSNSMLSNYSLYHQNIFKIDDYARYYPGSIPSTNATQEFYIGDPSLESSSLNASLSNLCINSPLKSEVFETVYRGEVRCGDYLDGVLSWSEMVYYYYFELSHTSDVIFSSCGSSAGTYTDFHDLNYNAIAPTWLDDCSPGSRKLIPSLVKGRYIIEVGANADIKDIGHDYRAFYLSVTCNDLSLDDNDHKHDSDVYILSDFLSENVAWFEAERKCEQLYGSTLATIITNEDMTAAVAVVQDSLGQNMGNNASIWIGLYGDHFYWQWVDGTPCNYTASNNCMDDTHWQPNRPNAESFSNESYVEFELFGAVLFITELRNKTNSATFYDAPLGVEPTENVFFLCNGPASKYSIQPCTGDSCWRKENDINIQSTTAIGGSIFSPSIAYWNSTLFVVGVNTLYYSHKKPLDNADYEWNHKSFINTTVFGSWNSAQMYAQHQSSFYIYGTEYNEKSKYNQASLVKIDLNTLESFQEKFHFVENVPLIVKCIVADDNAVYFMEQIRSLIYDTSSRVLKFGHLFNDSFINLPAFTERTTSTSCIITNDKQFIYVFAMAYVTPESYDVMFMIAKYETKSQTIISVDLSDECLTRNGYVTAVAAANNKVYLHGCHASGWKTMIFNTLYDTFDYATIDMQQPNKANLPYVRSSQLVAVDDNILYLFSQVKNGVSAYSTITDQLSINFAETDTTSRIWPSQGIEIKYSVNDFRELSTTNYALLFFMNATNVQNVSKWVRVTLSTSDDDCICDEWTCDDCRQHFSLRSQLTLEDNKVDKLMLMPYYAISQYNTSHPLIIPNAMTFSLQHCVISISKHWEAAVKAGVHVSLRYNFSLSPNCYARVGAYFSLNATVESIGLKNNLTIGIQSRNTIVCKVCDLIENTCVQCGDFQFTIIKNIDDTPDSAINTRFVSNNLDFRVVSAENDTFSHWKNKTKWNKEYLWFATFIIVIPIVLSICRQQYMNAFIVNKALVLIIPIANFDKSDRNLGGVKANMIQLEHLWKNEYLYDVFVCNKMTLYSTRKDIRDFIDRHKDHQMYKAVIVHVITHGSEDSFLTSDMKSLPIDFIQHLLFSDTSTLIKVIFNHACRGEGDFSSSENGRQNLPESVGSHCFPINCCCSKSVVRKGTDGNYVHMSRQTPVIQRDVNNNQSDSNDMGPDANLAIVAGNIKGRTMSDAGNFSECICESFGNNLKFNIKGKANFNTLLVEIGRNVGNQTQEGEVVNWNVTFRYSQVRFEKNERGFGCLCRLPKIRSAQPNQLKQPLLQLNDRKK